MKNNLRNKKYRLSKIIKYVNGHTLHRIRALRDIPLHQVEKGDLGGWIESTDNLSQECDCWVADEAMVYEDACVEDDAVVSDEACVWGNARISRSANIGSSAKVFGDALVTDFAWVIGDAKVYDSACVTEGARVGGDARVYGCAKLSGNVIVSWDTKVFGDAHIRGEAEIVGDALVGCTEDVMVFKNTWSSGRYITYTSSNKMWVAGCFYGTGKELIKRAYKDSELSGKCYEAIVKAVETIERAKRINRRKKKKNESE